MKHIKINVKIKNQNIDKKIDINTNAKSEYEQASKMLSLARDNYRHIHNHKNGKYPLVVDIDRVDHIIHKPYYVNNDLTSKDTIVMCEECGAIFDTKFIATDKFEEMLFLQESMLHQIKLLSAYSPEEYERIMTDCFMAIETLRKANEFYNDIIKHRKNINKK